MVLEPNLQISSKFLKPVALRHNILLEADGAGASCGITGASIGQQIFNQFLQFADMCVQGLNFHDVPFGLRPLG